MSIGDQEQLRQLADLMADGTATAADAARLSNLLRDRADLRELYMSYLDTHAALTWEFRNVALTKSAEQPAPVPVANHARSRLQTFLPWVVALVAVIVAAVSLVQPPKRIEVEVKIPQVAKDIKEPLPDSIAALLVDETGAKFAEGRGPDGVRFGRGTYELLTGVVHLRFTQGVDVVLAGPARLDVNDAMHARLAYGKVRVIAPPMAEGFTITTPAADYVDLGTEFGLRVERQTGASDLYVFDGQVNVADSQSGKVLSEVFQGESSRRVDGISGVAPKLEADDFPTPGAIGFERWQEYERTLRKDRGLLASFPFQRTADESLLPNVVDGKTVTDGRISGARWTSGRWPGKDALLFDRDSDFVEIAVPGEYHELTVAVWLKLDRLDHGMNAILNSNRSDDGVSHFQLTRQGIPRGGVMGTAVTNDTFYGTVVPIGKWTHVASVISGSNRTACFYVNGKLTLKREMQSDCVIRPGMCRIGNWLATDPKWLVRALCGRIDELAIWNRALPEEELRRNMEGGRPGLLWGEEGTEASD